MNVLRTILVGLALCASAYAQQRNTVYQQLFDGPITTAPETSSVFYAIGQTQHKVSIVLSDGGGVCVGGFVDIYLEGSGTGAVGTYNTIGNPVNNISVNQYGQYVAVVEANIALPFVRLVVNSFDTANCQLSALYSGTIAPTESEVRSLFYPLQEVANGVPLDRVATDNIVDASKYTTHRIYYDLTNCSGGGSIYEIGLQLQYSFSDNGPWLPLGYYGFTSSVEQGIEIEAVGNFPLIRGWMIDTNTNCNATVYYWGSTEEGSLESSINIASISRGTAVTGGGTLTSTIVGADVGSQFVVTGLVLNNPCAAGRVRIQPSSLAGEYIVIGPNTTVYLDSPREYFKSPIDEGLVLNADGTLTASCTASVMLIYAQINPVYP